MEVKQNIVKDQLDIIWRPHPIVPAADCQFRQQEWKQGLTVRQILIANGIDQHQPISIIVDDRLLTVDEWDTFCPNPGQIINVKAEVAGGGGGGGGSNVLQTVAMIALIVVVSYFTLGAGYGALAAAGTWQAAAVGAAIMAVGSFVINSVFAAQMPGMDYTSQANGAGANNTASPTYSLSGGSNRQRPYESMPVIMGKHKFFFDQSIRPYVQYNGEDQYLYQIFNLGLSAFLWENLNIGTNDLYNYQDWSYYWSDQYGVLPNFANNVDSTTGAGLTYDAGWVIRTTSENTLYAGIDIEGVLYYANDSGGLDRTDVEIVIEYRDVNGGDWIAPTDLQVQGGEGFISGYWESYEATVSDGYWKWEPAGFDEYGNQNGIDVWVDTSYTETRWRFVSSGYGVNNTIDIYGNSQTSRRGSIYVYFPTFGQYEVRVKRNTADSTNSRLQNKTNWSSLRSYQADPSDYTGQTRFGLVIRASEQLNGVVSQLNAICYSYALYFDGVDVVWNQTSNPAHWFMDFAVGRRDYLGNLVYGLGLSWSQLDYVQLAQWATFCDNEGLTFNAVFDDNKTAAEVMTLIARCGFASPTWSSGKLGVVWDARNQTPTAAFGMSNIIKGSFNVTYITEQLAEEIIVRYVEPDMDWAQNEVRVNVPGITNPLRTSTIDLFGCTNKAMAGKFANYVAAQQYYRRRRITWDCDFEGFVCQRGDVVLLSHDLTQWGYSGRVVDVNSNVITFDREVPRSGSTEYVMIRQPDGTMTTYYAVAGSGNQNTLTLSSAPTIQAGYELMDHIWFFSPLETPGKKVKILSVQPTSESRVQIVATDEDPEFYAAWDGTWYEPNQETLLNAPYVTISNIRAVEKLVLSGGSVISEVGVTWDVMTNVTENIGNVRYQIDGGTWQKPDFYGNNFARIYVDKAATLTVEITENVLGASATQSQSFAIYCRSLKPADVSNFALNIKNGVGLLTFDEAIDLDVIYGGKMWLRYSSLTAGATWNNSVDVAISIPGKSSSATIIPQAGTYLAKWVDSDGNSSENATIITTDYTTIEQLNVYDTISGQPSWSGTKVNMAYDSDLNGLALDSSVYFDSITTNIDTWNSFSYEGGVASSGSYSIDTYDVGKVYTCVLNITEFEVETYDAIDMFDARLEDMDTWPWMNGAGSDDANSAIYVRFTNDDPSSISANWSDWQTLANGSFTARGYDFELRSTTTRSEINICVKKATISIDMPDRIESDQDIVSGATAKTITFAEPFFGPVNIGITTQNMATGDYYKITSKSGSSFTIEFRNSSNALISRTFDWIARSY